VRGDAPSAQPAAPTPGGGSDESLSNGVAGEAFGSSSDSLLERAQSALDAGNPDAAVQLAYAAFRAQITLSDGELPETHWELYDRWEKMDRSDPSQVHRLTTAYEQATFAPESVSTETAQTVVGMLPSLVGGSEAHKP
jgi:hypothetical protein